MGTSESTQAQMWFCKLLIINPLQEQWLAMG